MTGFGGRQTTRGQEWEQETGEEVAASCPGERPCSGSETGELYVSIARGRFLEDVVRHELNLWGYGDFWWEVQNEVFSKSGQRCGQMLGECG